MGGPLPQPSPDPKSSSYCDGGPIPRCPPDEEHQPPPSPYLLPPPPAASHGRSTFVTALIIVVPVLAFLALCLSILVFLQRRRLRRRREALLEAAPTPPAPAAFPDDGDGAEGEVVHHAWHIRTVGLDDAAIESIALTRYRAGGGVLGASDCTVCLGEFQDGELLRLLPKCAHAFHVQCIDTWLRAHVTCPLCRADVMVSTASASAAAADAEQPPGADASDDGASAEQPASNTRTMEQERPGQQANERQEHRVQIDQPDHSSSLELERPRRQIPRPGARAQNFRRVASMDSPAASAEEAPEGEQLQAGGRKQGTGRAVCCEVSPEPGHQLKRSLSASNRWTLLSRHCRTRSSLLPL